jgi:hypothetical protein
MTSPTAMRVTGPVVVEVAVVVAVAVAVGVEVGVGVEVEVGVETATGAHAASAIATKRQIPRIIARRLPAPEREVELWLALRR